MKVWGSRYVGLFPWKVTFRPTKSSLQVADHQFPRSCASRRPRASSGIDLFSDLFMPPKRLATGGDYNGNNKRQQLAPPVNSQLQGRPAMASGRGDGARSSLFLFSSLWSQARHWVISPGVGTTLWGHTRHWVLSYPARTSSSGLMASRVLSYPTPRVRRVTGSQLPDALRVLSYPRVSGASRVLSYPTARHGFSVTRCWLHPPYCAARHGFSVTQRRVAGSQLPTGHQRVTGSQSRRR